MVKSQVDSNDKNVAKGQKAKVKESNSSENLSKKNKLLLPLYTLSRGRSVKYIPTLSTPNSIKTLNPLGVKPDSDNDIENLIINIISIITNNNTNIVSVVCSVPNGKCHNFLIIKLKNSIGIVDHKYDARYMKTMEINQKNNYKYIIDEVSRRIFQKVMIKFIDIDKEIIEKCSLYRYKVDVEKGINACNVYVDNWIAKHIHIHKELFI